LNKHPLIVGDFFKRKFEKHFRDFCKTFGVKHFWWRFEFQARGSFHVHALVWMENDPGICCLVKTA